MRGGKTSVLDADGVCAELKRVDTRFRELTGRALDPVWSAPGGHTTANALAAARRCGFEHVRWTSAGALGDELPSDRYPNEMPPRAGAEESPRRRRDDDAPRHPVAAGTARADARSAARRAQGARVLLRDDRESAGVDRTRFARRGERKNPARAGFERHNLPGSRGRFRIGSFALMLKEVQVHAAGALDAVRAVAERATRLTVVLVLPIRRGSAVLIQVVRSDSLYGISGLFVKPLPIKDFLWSDAFLVVVGAAGLVPTRRPEYPSRRKTRATSAA